MTLSQISPLVREVKTVSHFIFIPKYTPSVQIFGCRVSGNRYNNERNNSAFQTIENPKN